MEIKDNIKVKASYTGTYVLTAKGKDRNIKWKGTKRKNQCVQFEIEDIYINANTGMMYFNSEGGDCHDFLGSMSVD